MEQFSDAYAQHLSADPFPARIDPWSEAQRYFKQISESMIFNFAAQTHEQLLRMGYIPSLQASLQLAEEPDIDDEVRTHAFHVRQRGTRRLVSVVEIILPDSKSQPELALQYEMQRNHLLKEQGVHFVEIDLTRSLSRIQDNSLTASSPYHVAVHLSGEASRFILMEFDQFTKRFALPLISEVVPVELQAAYDRGYRQVTIAGQIYDDGLYDLEHLPFSSLLTERQCQQALEAVHQWKQKLMQLGMD